MPNPKLDGSEIGKAIQDVKSGKIDFKVDKFGIVHAGVGKASFSEVQIEENVQELLSTIVKLNLVPLRYLC